MLSADYEKNFHLLQWPQSARLKRALREGKHQSADPRSSDMCYTRPGVRYQNIHKATLTAPQQRFIETHFDDLNAELVGKGFAELFKNGEWTLALDATSRLLELAGQGNGKAGKRSLNTPLSLEIWSIRFQLMQKLEMHAQLNEELLPFEELDAPDLYYDYYPQHYRPSRKGSMVSFAFRLLHAAVLLSTPLPHAAITRISKLEENTREMVNTTVDADAKDVWAKRLSAVQNVKMLALHRIKAHEDSMLVAEEEAKKCSDELRRNDIALGLVRQALTFGDEKRAVQALSILSPLADQETVLVHKTFRAIFLGDFAKAHEILRQIPPLKGGDSPQVSITAALIMLYTAKPNEAKSALRRCRDRLNKTAQSNLKILADLTCAVRAKEKFFLLTERRKSTPTASFTP